MTKSADTQTARRCFKAVIGLAVCLVLAGHMWLATYAANSVDGILTQEELQDPKLINIVYRTQQSVGILILIPSYAIAVLLTLTAFTGLGSLRKAEQ